MAKPFFRGTWKKWLWGSKMDKMVTRGRLSIHLKNASKLSKEWGEGHGPIMYDQGIDYLAKFEMTPKGKMLYDKWLK
jgi:hypothetical protein